MMEEIKNSTDVWKDIEKLCKKVKQTKQEKQENEQIDSGRHAVEINNKENEARWRPKESNQKTTPKSFPKLKDMPCQMHKAHRAPRSNTTLGTSPIKVEFHIPGDTTFRRETEVSGH